MSESSLRTDGSLEAQPRMGVRNLHNFIYCPRLFYFQWVENIFQESADTVAGSHVHRNVDAPSKLDDPKELGLPEGAKLRSLRLESEALGLIGVVDIVEGGPDGAEIIDYKKGSARRDAEGEGVASRIRYLVSYDISDPKRLRKVARSLEGFGVRLQYSVFECPLDDLRLAKLRSELQDLLNHDEDQVLFVSLGASSKDASLIIDAMGLPYEVRSRVTII